MGKSKRKTAVDERTVPAAPVCRGRRQLSLAQQTPHLADNPFDFAAQCFGKNHFPSASGPVVVQSPPGYGPVKHLFQAKGLGAELYFVGAAGKARARLVLHRIRRPVRQKLHHVGLAD